MKKGLTIIILFFSIIIVILWMKLSDIKAQSIETAKINGEYEYYDKSDLYGIDITTVINKAINNNEKYEIEKNEKNRYIDDGKNSIQVKVKIKSNDTTYDMEQIYNLGTEKFILYYGDVMFNCTNIEYHEKTGKISKLEFVSEE